jgi:hypothetical protein
MEICTFSREFVNSNVCTCTCAREHACTCVYVYFGKCLRAHTRVVASKSSCAKSCKVWYVCTKKEKESKALSVCKTKIYDAFARLKPMAPAHVHVCSRARAHIFTNKITNPTYISEHRCAMCADHIINARAPRASVLEFHKRFSTCTCAYARTHVDVFIPQKKNNGSTCVRTRAC